MEGITDRLYFRHFLEIYQQSLPSSSQRFLEDVHFSFVEYGGGNITHWSFLDSNEGINAERLCGRLMLISDSDDAADRSKKAKRHEQLKTVLEDRFLCLECREVENLLVPDVLKSVIREYEGDDVELKDFQQDAYKTRYLGTFIESSVLINESTRTASSGRPSAKGKKRSKGSGTIKDKDVFCRKAISHIKSVDDLSPEALKTVKRIYDFIAEQNK